MDKEDTRTDQVLIDAARGGDEGAFEVLYYRYRDWAACLALRFTGNEADALDVLQNTFIYLVEKLPGLRLTASMTTFLYPVVKHLAIDIVRRKRPHEPAETLEGIPARQDPPDSSPQELAAALSALGDLHREVVLMRFVDDMSIEEIANALGIPEGTVKSRLHNALRTLREDPRTREYFLG